MGWGVKGEKRKKGEEKQIWLIINMKAVVPRKKYGYRTNLKGEAEG